MDLRTLRAFVEVVRQGGFTQAAKTVFATQSTVSKAVKQLEDEIGMPLLNRVGHEVTLTTAGDVVFQRALKMLAERDDLLGELDELRDLKRGTLRLGLPPVSSGRVFAPYFAAYRRRHPLIEIRLTEHGAERLQQLLLSGEIEMAAALLPIDDEAFERQDVRQDQLVVAVGGDSPLAQKAKVKLAELRDQPFILFNEGFALSKIVLDQCRGLGFEPEVVARSGQLDFIIELVGAGVGVAFLPSVAVGAWPHPSVVYVPVDDPPVDYHTTMIWRAGGFLSHAARAWLEVMRDMGEPAAPGYSISD